uniref:Alternative protein KIAA0319 n=1 Tax=Homo sapiens TaxID=9606 RepID=L8E9P4_HUMAN|nr:alternative protein KIAA0319 [Homo sapiens]
METRAVTITRLSSMSGPWVLGVRANMWSCREYRRHTFIYLQCRKEIIHFS